MNNYEYNLSSSNKAEYIYNDAGQRSGRYFGLVVGLAAARNAQYKRLGVGQNALAILVNRAGDRRINSQ